MNHDRIFTFLHIKCVGGSCWCLHVDIIFVVQSVHLNTLTMFAEIEYSNNRNIDLMDFLPDLCISHRRPRKEHPWFFVLGCLINARFLRYFFPLEADRRQQFEDQTSQTLSQASQGPKSNGPLDAPANSNVRLPMYGHYDVVCPWNPVSLYIAQAYSWN